MIQNAPMVLRRDRSSSRPTRTKSSLPKSLVHRTSKEFDHCTELLRNILSVQESRRNLKSSAVSETKGKNVGQASIGSRTTKKQQSKGNISKSSLIKTNINNGSALSQGATEAIDRRSTFVQETSNAKKPSKFFHRHPSPTKHFHCSRFPSPKSPTRGKSPLPVHRPRRHDTAKRSIRSSSCANFAAKKKKNSPFPKSKQFVFDQLGKYLKQIQILSKQIRWRNFHSIKDAECSRLWSEFDHCLSSALAFLNSDRFVPFSFELLQKQLSDLKEELKTTNVHLHAYDLTRRAPEQYVHSTKKSDLNSIQSRQFVLHNEQLKLKCDDLQTKLEQLQRNNRRLVERLNERDLRSLVEHQRWMTTNNRFLLREEIVSLREKLYTLYEDLTTLINQDRSLRFSIEQQKREILSYKNLFEKHQQSAAKLVRHLDHRSIDEKVNEFLTDFLREQYRYGMSNNVPSTRLGSKDEEPTKHLHRQSSSSSSSSTTIADADPTLVSSNFPFANAQRSNESEADFDQISDLTSKMFSSADDDEDHGVFVDPDLSSSSSSSPSSSSVVEINRLVPH